MICRSLQLKWTLEAVKLCKRLFLFTQLMIYWARVLIKKAWFMHSSLHNIMLWLRTCLTCCEILKLILLNVSIIYVLYMKFCSFILVSVYIPPQVHVSSAYWNLLIWLQTQKKHPDSVLIILGDFNKQMSPANSQNTDSILLDKS